MSARCRASVPVWHRGRVIKVGCGEPVVPLERLCAEHYIASVGGDSHAEARLVEVATRRRRRRVEGPPDTSPAPVHHK